LLPVLFMPSGDTDIDQNARRVGPRRREAAFCHGALSHWHPHNALLWAWRGDDAMHVADYVAFSLLIACMIAAGVMAVRKAP